MLKRQPVEDWLPPALRPVRRQSLLCATILLAITTQPASADLAQLGDAMADVATFGAWGQSRDLAKAEIERLKLRFAEELQRAANRADASVATARIEEKVAAAIDARQLGQDLLKIIAATDVLLAQQKDVIVERFKVNTAVTRFSEWFDTFVTATNDKLDQLIVLFKISASGDQEAIAQALEAAQLASLQSEADIARAKKELRTAMEASKADTMAAAMKTLLDVRASLAKLLEGRRQQLRKLIVEMAAEDAARRTLCEPSDALGVSCDAAGSCRYYSPDPAHPLPCSDLVYLNAFPVIAIKAIYDDPEAYDHNAEFFVNLEMLGTVRPPTIERFRSPTEVFGDALKPEKLLPDAFLRPQGCGQITKYQIRLMEALSFAAIFAEADDRSQATRNNIKALASWRVLIEFWLEDAGAALPPTTSCTGLSAPQRRKLRLLVAAVSAAEEFGSALTNNVAVISDNAGTLAAVDVLAHDF